MITPVGAVQLYEMVDVFSAFTILITAAGSTAAALVGTLNQLKKLKGAAL